MAPLSINERQKRKNERDLANGIVRREVRIPIERDAELKQIAAEWRAQKLLKDQAPND